MLLFDGKNLKVPFEKKSFMFINNNEFIIIIKYIEKIILLIKRI